jgi:hypothetical protein
MGIFNSSPKMGVLSGGASSYSNASSKGIPVSYSEDPKELFCIKQSILQYYKKCKK